MIFFKDKIADMMVGIILLCIAYYYFNPDLPPTSNIKYSYKSSQDKQFKQLQQGEILHSGDYLW